MNRIILNFWCRIPDFAKWFVFKDIWMGTQLLFVDIMCALGLLFKQLHGHKVTKRERKKLKSTLNDIATLIPVTILMLLPVSTYLPYLFLIITNCLRLIIDWMKKLVTHKRPFLGQITLPNSFLVVTLK